MSGCERTAILGSLVIGVAASLISARLISQSPPPQLPTSNASGRADFSPRSIPRLALDGCSPVALVDEHAWRLGNPRYRTVFKAQTYFFSGSEDQQKFCDQPEYYSAKSQDHAGWRSASRRTSTGLYY